MLVAVAVSTSCAFMLIGFGAVGYAMRRQSAGKIAAIT